MSWYKDLKVKFEKEFILQFVKGGSNPYIEFFSAGQEINIVFKQVKYEGKDYFLLNFVHSNGKCKDVVNRIRKVIREFGAYRGIIYECVISEKMYQKVKEYQLIDDNYSIEGLADRYKKYYEKPYGTFVETFNNEKHNGIKTN